MSKKLIETELLLSDTQGYLKNLFTGKCFWFHQNLPILVETNLITWTRTTKKKKKKTTTHQTPPKKTPKKQNTKKTHTQPKQTTFKKIVFLGKICPCKNYLIQFLNLG